MRITRKIDDFMIHTGASARGDRYTKKAVAAINRDIKDANIPGTKVRFANSFQDVSGKTVAEKTILGLFSPEKVEEFGLPSFEGVGGYQATVTLGSEEHKAYLKLFKAEKIKAGRNLEKTSHFIMLNNEQLNDTLYGRTMPFHEISHAFSEEAGLTQIDYTDTFEVAVSAFEESYAKPGDLTAYHNAFGAYIDRMKGTALEEARADSGAMSFMVKSGLADVINNQTTDVNQFIGYPGLHNWKNYEDQFRGPMDAIIRGLHASKHDLMHDPIAADRFEIEVEGMMYEFEKQGRMAAHTTYHANLQIPKEIDTHVRSLLDKGFEEEARFKGLARSRRSR